jgi:hypothetical protein
MEQNIVTPDNGQLSDQIAPEAVKVETTNLVSERLEKVRLGNGARTQAPRNEAPPEREPSDAETADHDGTAASHLLGRVATPTGMEATADDFAFWVPEGVPVEATQIVRASAYFPSVGDVQFYGVVEGVSRRSRRSNVLEERDRYDGTPDQHITVDSLGVTYAKARILATQPALLTPPREESPVVLASTEDASVAYGVGEMTEPLPIGLIKNGASGSAGPAMIDLADVLGQNGAHVNVTGIPGAATKSSALLDVLCAIQHHVQYREGRYTDPLHIVPVILNVKATDLLFIDQQSRTYNGLQDRDGPIWREMGIDAPGPFAGATFHVPQQQGAEAPEQRGREAQPYSWGLEDLVERNLFQYIFAEDDREDENFAGLLSTIERKLARDRIQYGRVVPQLREEAPFRTLQELTDWVADQLEDGSPDLRPHHTGTITKLHRRLLRIMHSGSGVLRIEERRGHPLDITATETVPPRVVDIAAIGDAGLQRFVVGAIVRQIADARVGPHAVRGLRYLVMLDELNRWAPRGGRDPITKLIERVAAEMRSQGVVLLGAQQQASTVSEKVIEAAAIRMLGRTGSLELEQTVWKSVPPAFRRIVTGLRKEEKVVLTPSARQPMIIRMPCPAWAMNQEDVVFTLPATGRMPRTERED